MLRLAWDRNNPCQGADSANLRTVLAGKNCCAREPGALERVGSFCHLKVMNYHAIRRGSCGSGGKGGNGELPAVLAVVDSICFTRSNNFSKE